MAIALMIPTTMSVKEFENHKSCGNLQYYMVCTQYRNKGKWLINVIDDKGMENMNYTVTQ